MGLVVKGLFKNRLLVSVRILYNGRLYYRHICQLTGESSWLAIEGLSKDLTQRFRASMWDNLVDLDEPSNRNVFLNEFKELIILGAV